MIKRNQNFEKLPTNYLFSEINQRKKAFLSKKSQADIINLGVGDTTEPLPQPIAKALKEAANLLGTREGYSGYGPEQGIEELRVKISDRIYQGTISADEIFISDGAKCDIGRLQVLFGKEISVGIQDPAYPVYVDGSLLQGVKEIHFLPCLQENDFFPDLKNAPKVDLLYFCSPNNPTGAAVTLDQLKELVDYAKEHKAIILFDAAYSTYIKDSTLPKSIYEIEGADEVAIETHSFSKFAGFTGVRLGWTVVPKKLQYEDGRSVRDDWNRLTTTIFNGASNIAQRGGMAVLDNIPECENVVSYYMENAALLKEALEEKGYTVFGGVNAPYLWVSLNGKKSWDVFQEFLSEAQIIVTPGVGFGKAGEGFVRVSAFNTRFNILKAIERIKSKLKSREFVLES